MLSRHRSDSLQNGCADAYGVPIEVMRELSEHGISLLLGWRRGQRMCDPGFSVMGTSSRQGVRANAATCLRLSDDATARLAQLLAAVEPPTAPAHGGHNRTLCLSFQLRHTPQLRTRT